jgi:hypothetical protein
MERIDDNNGARILDEIVSFEWDMFQAVNEGGPRADCQDDRATFEGMRRAQFQAWSPEACASYFDDLLNAILEGRNLVSEKYIHMMKNTSPRQYAELLRLIPVPGEDEKRLANDISQALLEETEALQQQFPYVSGSGRPLRAQLDFTGVTSIETYQLSELLTYSGATLTLLREHLTALRSGGKSLAREILENTVKHYGYSSLESAEAATKARIDKEGIRASFGCGDGDDFPIQLKV